MQNCRFHVQHWLALGKSLDSPKRARGENRISLGDYGAESVLEDYNTNGELFESVSFQDVVLTLSSHLKPPEQKVLHGLAEGFVLRDVAAKAKLSYPTALKYRKKIAGLSVKLGIAPPERVSKKS